MYGRTFETGFIRWTLKGRPNKRGNAGQKRVVVVQAAADKGLE